jgi:peptidoglycan/LPS O-acetylase OafA/YrhL
MGCVEQGGTAIAAMGSAEKTNAADANSGAHTGSNIGRPSRVGELDALRGLAALGVVVFHYTTFYQQEQGHLQALGFGFPAGNYGVHLFFLISGFVIFMTLERTRTAMDFVASRFSRLFPAYWVAIAITAAVVYAIGLPGQPIGGDDLFANFTMLQEILGFDHLDGSYWTLQVELFFYAQMLLWFALGQLRHVRWIILLWLAMAVAYALIEKNHLHFSYTLREALILRHIPFFAIGILFYKLYTRSGDARVDLALILLALAAIGVSYAPVYLVAGVACCAIFGMFLAGWLRWLRAGPFVFLGGISYSLYLLHQAIGFAVIHRLEAAGLPSLAAVALAIGISLILATTLTRVVERPAMRVLREGWRRRRAA